MSEIIERVRGDSRRKVSTREANKGARGIPWLSEAKKGAISCDNLRGGANSR